MNAYDIALFVHMIGLIALFGGFVIYVRAGVRLRAATDMEQVRAWLGLLESTSPMFASGTVMLLLSGLFMTVTRLRSPHPWIVVALVGLLTIWILGATVAGRQLRDIRAAVTDTRGSIPGELSFRIANPFPWTVMAALNGLALGIVFVMSTKPGWLGSTGVAVITTVISAAVGARVLRRDRYAPSIDARAAQS